MHSLRIVISLMISGLCFWVSLFAENEFSGKLQAELNGLIVGSEVPGATLAVILPDDTLINLSAGVSDLENRRPMRPTDVMLSGSIGKTYVMAVLMQLVDEKRMAIDDYLWQYLGREPWFSRLPNARDVTLRMLLNHTAGIPEYIEKESLWDEVREHPDKVWSGPERLIYILGDSPRNEAGKGWSYADTHYIVLGMVIEKVTGTEYYRELQQRILTPMKLERTIPADRRILPGLIPGYSRLDSPFNFKGRVLDEKGRYLFNPQLEWTGGGLASNAAELAKWAKILFSGQVIEKELLPEIMQGVKTGSSYEYGLGVIIWNADFGTLYGHMGFAPGYNSIMGYVPSRKIAVAMQFNCDYPGQVLKKDRYECLERFIRLAVAFAAGSSPSAPS